VTDLFIDDDKRIVDIDGDFRRQRDWCDGFTSTRRRKNVGKFNRTTIEERFEKSFIAGYLRRHDAIHALNGGDIRGSGGLCPSTCRRGTPATRTSSAKGLLSLNQRSIRLGERSLSLSQRLFRSARSGGGRGETNGRLRTQSDGSGGTASRRCASGSRASGNGIQRGTRKR
jgi:hypothetical protein